MIICAIADNCIIRMLFSQSTGSLPSARAVGGCQRARYQGKGRHMRTFPWSASIQSARELFTLYSIQEIFRNEVPNGGSLVKVNFEQKEIEIAGDYSKAIIGQKQPIQANFEPSYFVSVCPASAFGGCSGTNSNILKFSTKILKHTMIWFLASSASIPRSSFSMNFATSSLFPFRRKKRWVQKGLANSLLPSFCIWCRLLLVSSHDKTLKDHEKEERIFALFLMATRSLHAIGFWLLLCDRRRRSLLIEN